MQNLTTRLALGAILALSVTAASEAAPRKEVPARGTFDVTRMAPLTDKPGDPVNGRLIASTKGLCLACHVLPIPEQADHGELGPPLSDVASRLQAAEIRMRIVDPKMVFADTIMPSFHKTEGLFRVDKKWEGKTILSAQEVEDVVAYLTTLKE